MGTPICIERRLHLERKKYISNPYQPLFSGQDVEKRGLEGGTKRTRRTSTLSVILYFFKEIWKNIHNFPFLVLDICIAEFFFWIFYWKIAESLSTCSESNIIILILKNVYRILIDSFNKYLLGTHQVPGAFSRPWGYNRGSPWD